MTNNGFLIEFKTFLAVAYYEEMPAQDVTVN